MPRKSRAVPPSPFRRFTSSSEVIRLAVIAYVRFPLPLRNVGDLLFERGMDVCRETVRVWRKKFGPMFAGDMRRRLVSRIRGFSPLALAFRRDVPEGERRDDLFWRMVARGGEVLESHVPKTRDEAALTFIADVLKRHGSLQAISPMDCVPAARR